MIFPGVSVYFSYRYEELEKARREKTSHKKHLLQGRLEGLRKQCLQPSEGNSETRQTNEERSPEIPDQLTRDEWDDLMKKSKPVFVTEPKAQP